MSIAAAENAGLGPCDLPLSDPWVTHPTQTSGVCSLPLSSPAAATAAVAVSASAIGGGYHQVNTTNTTATLLQQQQPQQLPNQQSPLSGHHPAHLQNSSQAKIMNAVASAVACPPTAVTNRKIRRKTDSKPQSQINKCNNEKRRRELENNYIEQLGEFLQLNKRGDMTSTKPDKAAILNQVVKTYRDLFDKNNKSDNSASSSGTTRDNCTIHPPVQQGEVSSTEPQLPEPTINGQQPEISAYFEALEHYISSVGWILVQINADGNIESCTQNIKDLIGYERSELQKQPFYSYLHTGDHFKLSPIFNNMSFAALDEWGDHQDNLQHQKNRRSITTKIRMLVKHPENASETMEQKQQRQEKYEEVVLIAAPVKDDGDDSSSILCLITRPEEESPLETNMQQHTQQITLEQMTMELDTSGKIRQIDTSALRQNFKSHFAKEIGRKIQDLCHIQDLHTLQTHLKTVQQNSTSLTGTPIQSGPFRLRLGSPDAYVHVKANSRLFINTNPGESDYIMSVQTIMNDHNMSSSTIPSSITAIESSQNNSVVSLGVNVSIGGAGGIPSIPSTSHHHTSTTTNVGGPLMTSVINGTISQVQASPRTNSSVVTSFSSPPSTSESSNFFPADSFDFDFQQHSFEMDTVGWDSRPDSRTSVTTPGTPRPPSVQAYSPANPSPLTPYHTSQSAGQPSPQNNNNNNNNTSNNLNNNSGYGFSFPNFDEKDQKDHLNNNTTNNNNNNNNTNNSNGQNLNNSQNHDSERLRNLLTVKRNQSTSVIGIGGGTDDQDHRNTHRILKGLLNAEEEKDNVGYNKMNSALTQRMYSQRPRQIDNKSGNNLMLLQLLNEKSDDDDPESRSNRILNSELLRQLQKDDTPKEQNASNNLNQMGTEELKSLLRIQGNEYTRKRPFNEPDDGSSAKRPDDKPSKLREKNKMLASLLSNPAKAPTALLPTPVVKIIPDITSSTVNRVTSSSGMGQTGNQQQQQLAGPSLQQQKGPNQSQQQSSTNPHANQVRNVRKPSDAYLNQPMPTQQQTQQDQTKNQMMLGGNQASPSPVQRPQSTNFQMDLAFATSAATSSSLSLSVAATSSSAAQLQMASSSTGSGNPDQYEVDPELSKILNDVIDFVPDSYSSQDMNEKMAINAIQKSLMQFESSAFSGSPPAYPGIMGSQQQQQQQQMHQPNNPNNQGFSHPPPVYPSRQVRIPIPGNVANNQALRVQYRTDRLLQQQQKERLLQQQQKQHMVVPENATARADQLCLNPGMSNIGSLLNNTVAPNVSLTRSGLPDSQMSPNFPQSLMQQQLSPGQRGAPFSPQQNQGYQPQFSNNGQRLSPQQQQQLSQVQQQQQQQQMAFQTGTNSSNSAQLSPRQPQFNVNTQTVSGNVVSQPQPPQPNQQWNTAVPVPGSNTRISLQQHNPMLSAQLQSVSPYSAARQFQSQRRSLNSPGAPTGITRQNSFPTQDSGFPGPPSPSTQAAYGPATTSNIFNSQSLQRMQRQTSVPQATQHLPGSPRSFGGSDGTGGYGMMYNSMQHASQGPPPPNDFYGRNQTAGSGMNSSEYVRQELRAVVSGRTAQQTGTGGGTIPGGGGGGGGGGGNASTNQTGLRTPQSPLGLVSQGPMVGTNSTNSLGMAGTPGTQQQQQQQQQPQPSPGTQQSQQIPGTSLLNTPPDPTLNFSFDLPQTGTAVIIQTTKLPSTTWSSSGETASSATTSSRSIILEGIQPGDPNKSNATFILQKLLSD